MSEDYDDDLLNTEDSYTEDDFNEDDFSTPVAEGWHEVLIEKVEGEMFNFKEYTGPRAKIVMKIIDEDDADYGRKIFDNVNLPHEDEKPGNRKRRAAILSKLGKVAKGSSGDVKFNWKTLEGMTAGVEIAHNAGTGKNEGRTFGNPTFAGYRLPGGEAANAEAAEESTDATEESDDLGDI